MLLDNLLFEVFRGNLVQRAGCDSGGSKPQFLRLGKNLFVVQAELL
jgi:hypothetical protein